MFLIPWLSYQYINQWMHLIRYHAWQVTNSYMNWHLDAILRSLLEQRSTSPTHLSKYCIILTEKNHWNHSSEDDTILRLACWTSICLFLKTFWGWHSVAKTCRSWILVMNDILLSALVVWYIGYTWMLALLCLECIVK